MTGPGIHFCPLESYLPPQRSHQFLYALAQVGPKPEGGLLQSIANETEGIETSKRSRIPAIQLLAIEAISATCL